MEQLLLKGSPATRTNMGYDWQQHVPDSALQFIPDQVCKSKSCKGTDKGEFIVGNSKANKIDGLGGNDAIAGDDGNDTLIGGSGNDHLAGDHGKNKLTGGSGNDKFFFQLDDGNPGHSVITDYEKGDKIVVKGKIYKNLKVSTKNGDTILKYKGKEMAVVEDVSLKKGDIINQDNKNVVFPTPRLPEETSSEWQNETLSFLSVVDTF